MLLRGAERHTLRSYTRLLAGDPAGQVGAAWIATQELRHVYDARDLTQARDRLFTTYTVCADRRIPELHRLAAPSPPGRTSCSPTSPPAGPATAPSRP